MKTTRIITRRQAIVAGLASVGGLSLARFPSDLPPTYGSLLRMGDTLTYAAHRVLLPQQSLVREYSSKDITSFPATGTTNPGVSEKSALGEAYRRLEFGCVRRLAPLGRGSRDHAAHVLAQRSETTARRGRRSRDTPVRKAGPPLASGPACRSAWCSRPRASCRAARFVVFHSYDDWVDSIDLVDALHPQTILAYGMNGRDLPIQHGAPVRLRVERQMGYKSMKYLHRIVVADEFDDGGQKGNIQNGWAWYTGI